MTCNLRVNHCQEGYPVSQLECSFVNGICNLKTMRRPTTKVGRPFSPKPPQSDTIPSALSQCRLALQRLLRRGISPAPCAPLVPYIEKVTADEINARGDRLCLSVYCLQGCLEVFSDSQGKGPFLRKSMIGRNRKNALGLSTKLEGQRSVCYILGYDTLPYKHCTSSIMFCHSPLSQAISYLSIYSYLSL